MITQFREGERVHFRPLEDILSMLDTGYLELEYLSEGTTYSLIIRKHGDQYRLSGARAGELSSTQVDAPQLIDLVESQGLDLHAFRWYPALSLSQIGAYVPKSTSALLHERIDTLLGRKYETLLLGELPQEVSKCDQL